MHPLKRAFDLAGAIFLLVVVMPPVLLVYAFFVWLDGGGSVFFVQERIGWQGRTFRIIKFHTLHEGDSNEATRYVCRLSGAMRRFTLDELPQVVNVIRGHMSLVGPRPVMVEDEEALRDTPNWTSRTKVRPGCTCLDRVICSREKVTASLPGSTMKERDHAYRRTALPYDLRYIQLRSLGLDIWILARTAKAILEGHDTMTQEHIAALLSN